MNDLELIRMALKQAIEIAEQKGDRPSAVEYFLTGKLLKWSRVKDPVLRVVALQYRPLSRMLNDLIIYWMDLNDAEPLGSGGEEAELDPIRALEQSPWGEHGLSWERFRLAVEAYVNDPQPQTGASLLLAYDDYAVKSLALQRYICQRNFARRAALVSSQYFTENAVP